jgi:hypothetical protein
VILTQGEKMATNKDDKTNSKYRFLKEMDGMVSVNPGEGRQYDPDYDRRVRIKKIAKLLEIPCAGPRKPLPWEPIIITRKSLFAAAQLDANVSKNFKNAKANPLDKLEENIPEKNIKAISKAITNYFDVVEKAQLAIEKEIDKIIPEGIELTPIKIEKVVPPYVDVKIPVPEPRIPLDPKIPIPYPKTPLDPKIPIPRPEIRICGPIYDIKKLEVQLTEVERIRRDLPKNATKAEKKAAANAVQQVKNLLKAAKRAEPKAAKKTVAKKATVKKSATKKK